MLDKLTLDAREMEPPEPFEEATAILHHLKPGQYLRILHRRVPYPLFEFCRKMLLLHQVEETATASYEIIIYFPEDADSLHSEGVL